MVWNVPNTLTWLRIAAIPLIVLLFYMPYPWSDPAAALLFAAAGVTDSLDGYFARRLQQTSRLGAFLDLRRRGARSVNHGLSRRARSAGPARGIPQSGLNLLASLRV